MFRALVTVTFWSGTMKNTSSQFLPTAIQPYASIPECIHNKSKILEDL